MSMLEQIRRGPSVVTFVERATGRLVGRFEGDTNQVAVNTPAGCFPLDGAWDLLSYRYDQSTQSVVDYVPPAPDEFHEWRTDSRRWELREAVQARRAARAEALSQMEALEKRQARRVRELLAERDPQLKAIDDEAAALRQAIRDNSEP